MSAWSWIDAAIDHSASQSPSDDDAIKAREELTALRAKAAMASDMRDALERCKHFASVDMGDKHALDAIAEAASNALSRYEAIK